MSDTTNETTPATGLLTEKELFRLYLDAPQIEGSTSTLSKQRVTEENKLTRQFGYVESDLLPSDLPRDAVHNLVDDTQENDVEDLLLILISDFDRMSKELTDLILDFREFKEEFEAEEPSEDLPHALYNDPRKVAEAAQ